MSVLHGMGDDNAWNGITIYWELASSQFVSDFPSNAHLRQSPTWESNNIYSFLFKDNFISGQTAIRVVTTNEVQPWFMSWRRCEVEIKSRLISNSCFLWT